MARGEPRHAPRNPSTDQPRGGNHDHEYHRTNLPEVIDRLQELRAGSSKAGHPVPDTDEQHGVLRRRAQRREA